jgi:hypothetical protein
MCDSIVPGESPSYQVCKSIFSFHPLGEKVAAAPIRMAQSQKREIAIPAGPEDRLKEQFEKQWEEDGAQKHIGNVAKLARVYGIASLALLIDGVDPEVPLGSSTLSLDSLASQDIAFNIFDPLNTAGSLVLNQNPNAIDFQKTCNISVNGKIYHRSRSVILMNEEPIYIQYVPSAFGFVGRSCYQRALYMLKTFINSLITDDMVVRKVGVLVEKQKSPGSILDNQMMKISGIRRAILKMAQLTNVITIGTDEEVASLDFTNLAPPYELVRKNVIENIASAVPMPAKLLLQETFAAGFGEGTEDSKYIAQYIDDIREWMQPLYNFMDRIVKRRAWNPEFYKLIQADYPKEYGNVPYNTAFYRWDNSWKASWPSSLREPPSEKIKVDDVKLRAIIAFAEVLLPTFQNSPENTVAVLEWMADQVTEMKLIFSSPLVIDTDALLAELEEKQEAAKEQQSAQTAQLQLPKPSDKFADSASGREYDRAVSALTAVGVKPPRLVKR